MNNNSEEFNGGPLDSAAAPVGASAGLLVTSEDIKVHKEPRISANKLAEYVLADPSRQKTIIRDSKFAKTVIIVPYSKTRSFIPRAFGPDTLNIDMLVRRAEEIERENEIDGISEWHHDENTRSALALKKVAVVAPELSWKNARILRSRPGPLLIAGVQVSVHPEVIFTFEHRNITKLGAIILNTAKADDKSLDRHHGGPSAGDYLSSLLFQMLLSNAHQAGVPANSKCFALDVFREKVHTAPANYRTLNKHLEAACEVIASRWPATKGKA